MLDGKKTFIGLALMGAGYLGWSGYITPVELSNAVDAVLVLAGIIIAIYGRLVAVKTYI